MDIRKTELFFRFLDEPKTVPRDHVFDGFTLLFDPHFPVVPIDIADNKETFRDADDPYWTSSVEACTVYSAFVIGYQV